LKFGVSQEVNWKAEESSHALQDFVDKLAVKISSQDYGAAIEHFIIGFICIRTEPGYEEWYKERKPRFRKLKMLKILSDKYQSCIIFIVMILNLAMQR